MNRNKILLKFIFLTSVVMLGIVAPCIATTSCGGSGGDEPTPPDPPVEVTYNIDGTDWEGYDSGTLEYTKDEIDHTVTYTDNDSYVANNLIIPDEVVDEVGIQYNVTTIWRLCFQDSTGLTGSLTIGNNVSTIGNSAFAGCSRLTGNLLISNSVLNIDDSAFAICGFTGSLTIPSNVISIGYGAFYGCNSFDGNLIIENGVSSINNYAFIDCGFTGSLTIPSSVNNIGDAAFKDCSNLNGNLTIHNGVTIIGLNAFSNCSNLNGNLTIPDSVTTIGNVAFSNCSGLDGKLTIGTGVQTIGGGAFFSLGCEDIYLNSTWAYTGFTTWWNNDESYGDLTLGAKTWNQDHVYVDNQQVSIKQINGSNWQGRTGGDLTYTKNGDVVFYDGNDSYAANNLIIPDEVIDEDGVEYKVATIGRRTFMSCDSLVGSLTIGNNVLTISDSAFMDCTGLTGNLTMPNNIIEIEINAFRNIGCPCIYLDSTWAYTTFVNWYGNGSPTTDLTLGGKTWTSGTVYVDGSQQIW